MVEYRLISETVVDGDTEMIIKLTTTALKEGYPAEDILEKGLVRGINIIAEKFTSDRVLVPEVLMSARAMHAGMLTLDPYLKKSSAKNRDIKALIGTVEGDLHDIGKNLVKVLLSTVGVEVIDLGVDVSTKNFIAAVRKEKPAYLMMSALLTTTMPAMRDVLEALEKKNLRSTVKVAVGGGPLNEIFANEIGADYYFEDAFKLRQHFIKKHKGCCRDKEDLTTP